MFLLVYTITRCYGKLVTALDVDIGAGDSIKYQTFVYGSFVWEIHVRYNIFRIILTITLFMSESDITPCIEIDKPLSNKMMLIIMLHLYKSGESLRFMPKMQFLMSCDK